MRDFEKLYQNRIRGKKAKQAGDSFEDRFKEECDRAGLIATRVPDGCRQTGPKNFIRVKTPWDWVVTDPVTRKTALIDTKSANTKSFQNSHISEHQTKSMLPHENAGAIAGYVVWLRQLDSVIYIPSNILAINLAERGSIGLENKGVVDLGSMNQQLNLHRIFGDK